ncbi:MAG TPA: UDP-glucuronic acid decarboxylase family protein [Syntrophales bacterium]|nr:UDP-glucuronic acid decarboxylase family protein [Syntrophales bacterium]
MKRILITGGAGFLGSHLCDRLIEQGNEILCLDNFFTGSKDNIIHLLTNPLFELIRHDIINPILIEANQIFNLACPASPVHYQYNPIKTIKTNVMGTINTLGMAKRLNAKILQASTSEVYGDPDVHPQREDYWGRVNPIGRRSCYDEGKRAAECLMMDYHRQNNVKVKICRIFNTYGPRMALNDGRVVSNFIIQALKGQDITVYGDGSQTRSFCYVDDMIAGLIMMMASADSFLGPINLGNPEEFSILDLAETIISMTGKQSKVVFKPLPQDDPMQRKPDISLAMNTLGWQPRISLEEGLERTIAYFRAVI